MGTSQSAPWWQHRQHKRVDSESKEEPSSEGRIALVPTHEPKGSLAASSGDCAARKQSCASAWRWPTFPPLRAARAAVVCWSLFVGVTSQAWAMLERVVAGLPLFDRCSDHVCKRCCIYDSKGGDRGEGGGSLASLPTSWPWGEP